MLSEVVKYYSDPTASFAPEFKHSKLLIDVNSSRNHLSWDFRWEYVFKFHPFFYDRPQSDPSYVGYT